MTPAVDYVLIPRAAELTGYSKRAIETKIERGVWVEGREWVKAPDGRRMVNMKGVMRWVESAAASWTATHRGRPGNLG